MTMLSGLSWTLGVPVFTMAGATFLSVLLWFLLRQQKRRALLPILQVLELQLKAVPKLRWTKPPLWPFLCFLLAAAALAIFSLEPEESILTRENLDLRSTHVIFDLSPSLASVTTPEAYAVLADDLLTRLDHNTKLTFSVSSKPDILPLIQRDQLKILIAGAGFHRAGFKIGAAVERLLKIAPDIEHLVIVSDGDRASWEDFNWAYLEKKVQISWFPVTKEFNRSNNVFVDDVKSPNVSALQPSWTVVLRRSGSGDGMRGTLRLEMEGETAIEQKWSFEGATSTLEIEVPIPADLAKSQKALVWTIATDAADDLKADNTFRTWLNGVDKKAILISQPRGEMFLEDAFFHLKTSLDVLGFRTQRLDKIRPETRFDSQLLVAEAKPAQPRSFFCPGVQKANEFNRQVWLVPSEGMRDYGELCACAAGFIKAPEVLDGVPGYCQGIETRDQYVGVLQSIGALQLGGDVGSPLGALAMQYYNKVSQIRLLAFTVPLTPSAQTGVSFGRMPLILNALLNLAPLDSKDLRYGAWPRIDSITGFYGQESLDSSNVPFLESSLQSLPDNRLPPRLGFGGRGLIRQSSLANRENDARPWIIVCLWIMAAAIWLEALGYGIGHLFKGQRWVQRWFLLLLIGGALGVPKAEAQVRLNMLGYAKAPNLSTAKREIAGRTSIELLEQPKMNGQLNADSLSEPWLWVAQPAILEGLTPSERAELVSWLQRGGFLVLENDRGGGGFRNRLLEAIPQGKWKPIPPDHELMRSFHLLPSLPQCETTGWEGFQFDQRLAVLLIPGDFMESLSGFKSPGCFADVSQEQANKIFINLMMVVLTTDYKKDQVHLPEILKRLR